MTAIPEGTTTLVFPPFCGMKHSLRDIVPHLPPTLTHIDFGHEGITVDDERVMLKGGEVTIVEDLEALAAQCPALEEVSYCGLYPDLSDDEWQAWGTKHNIETVAQP